MYHLQQFRTGSLPILAELEAMERWLVAIEQKPSGACVIS